MSSTRSWAAAFGLAVSVVAIAGITVVASSKPVTAPAPQPIAQNATPVAPAEPIAEKQEPMPEPVPQPLPDQVGIEESAEPLTNQNPIDLISGTLAAVERGDRAWLARVMESRAGKVMLNEVDGMDAYRNFLWRSIAPRWTRIRAAWTARTYEVRENGDTAEIALEVGGNLGVDTVQLVKINGAWFFAGS